LNGEKPLFINQWKKKTTSMHLSVTLNIGKQIDYKYYSLGIPTEVDEREEARRRKERTRRRRRRRSSTFVKI
jgi:hypothetical protein